MVKEENIMKSRIAVFVLLAATVFFLVPADSNQVSAQPGQNKSRKVGKTGSNVGLWQPGKRGRSWNRGRKATYGYKNYGQYRRTQVGNRRYRLAKRYYWNDGTRLSRWVRVYY